MREVGVIINSFIPSVSSCYLSCIMSTVLDRKTEPDVGQSPQKPVTIRDVMALTCFLQLDRMESTLNEKVSKLQDCQQKKLQLEENVQGLRPQLRDMKNTLEKYANSLTVRQIHIFPFSHCVW